MIKTCSKCKQELSIECFDINKASKDGHNCICKSCRAEQRKLKAKEIAEYNKKYREEHKDYFDSYNLNHKEQSKKYREEHKEEKAIYDKIYISKTENKQRKQTYDKEYYQNNKDKIKEYAQINANRIKQRQREYRTNNTDKLREQNKQYYINNIKNNPQTLLNKNMSNAINLTLKSGVKSERHWENIVGYTLEDLIEHLESQFDERMNWNNHSINGWHIDHIIPKDSLPYDSPDDLNFKIVWSLYNLRPLWCTDNWCRPRDGSDVDLEKLKQFIIEDIQRKENKQNDKNALSETA